MNKEIYTNYASIAVLADSTLDKFTAWSKLYFKKNILKHLPSDREIKVLEIGCGYGRFLMAMQEEGYKNVRGIDISEEQVNLATKYFQLNNVMQADAVEYLQNLKEQFDIVIALDVFEHLELNYAIATTTLVYKALKPGGKLIVQTPNGISPLNPIFHSDITHIRAFSAKSLSQLLMMGGFKSTTALALPPIRHGVISTIRFLLWTFVISPFIKLFLLIANGDPMGGIYTSNILLVGTK